MTIILLSAVFLIAAIYSTSEERFFPKELPVREQCLICKTAANTVGWAEQNKLGKKYISDQMKRFCMFSKHPISCEIQSEQTLPLLMEAISTATHNHEICESIIGTDCKKVFKGQKLEGMDCTICKLWTKLVAKRIMSKSRQVKHYFELLCNSSKLNAKAKQQCINLFENRFDGAFKALVNMLVNTALCEYGHFCLTEGKSMTKDILMTGEDYGCTLCQSFAAYVEWAVEKSDFEEHYMKVLRKFCSFFPKDAQEQCTSFMDEYARPFMEDAVLIFSPDIFCPAIGLC